MVTLKPTLCSWQGSDILPIAWLSPSSEGNLTKYLDPFWWKPIESIELQRDWSQTIDHLHLHQFSRSWVDDTHWFYDSFLCFYWCVFVWEEDHGFFFSCRYLLDPFRWFGMTALDWHRGPMLCLHGRSFFNVATPYALSSALSVCHLSPPIAGVVVVVVWKGTLQLCALAPCRIYSVWTGIHLWNDPLSHRFSRSHERALVIALLSLRLTFP